MSVLADLPRRTRVAAFAGVCVFVLGGGVGLFGPVVRWQARAQAEKRRLQIQIGEVRPGLGAIWLRDVDLSAAELPGVRLRVDAIRVGLGFRFNVVELAMHGAGLALRGEPEELRAQLQSYRRERSEARAAETGPRYVIDGLGLRWWLPASQVTQYAWGVRYERADDYEILAADLVRVRDNAVSVEAHSPSARLGRSTNERHLESLHADAVNVSLTLPTVTQQPHPRVEKPAAFEPDELRGPKLRALLGELAAAAGRSLPQGAALDLEGVTLRFQRGVEALNFGPSALRVARGENQIELSLAPKAEATGTPLEFKLSVPLTGGEIRGSLRGGPVSLRGLGVREGDLGLKAVATSTLEASVDATLAADGSSVAYDGGGKLERVGLFRSELSPLPVTGIQLAFRARGSASVDGSRVTLEEGELTLGQVRVQGHGDLVRSPNSLLANWSGGIPLASCQALLDSAPHGLLPLLGPLRMSGTFAVGTELHFDTEHPNDARVRLAVANDCRISETPEALSPRRFQGAWRRQVKGADRLPMDIESGPGSADWVPYDSISPFMETAVLVCEDGGFLRHRGFDYGAIEKSVRDNLIKGHFVRGGSTISMQLAKNLYLSQEKTLGRKLQEAVLTQLLEQEFDKRELMELYLNVIEFGPGIYGIGPAARYYFDKRPLDLSLGQALYLASILPNPERQHFEPDGRVSVAWTRYLQRLMVIAKKIGRVTDEQLAAGTTEQVAFRVPDVGGGLPATNGPGLDAGDAPTELPP